MSASQGGRRLVRWIATVLLLAFAATAAAQSSTATISGTIRDETGVLPGATVSAKDAQSGFTTETVSGGDGSFALPGLRPGTFEITVSLPQYKPQSRTVRVLLGQTISADFQISPDLLVVESVQVTGDLLLDTRTPEI
jgi:hypothetical protein